MPIMLCDSNYLENPALRDYLAKTGENKLAISEQVLIEQHKSEPETTLRLSFKIASEFPRQVLVLKSIPGIYSRALHTRRDVRDHIDSDQSKSFGKWYDDVLQASEYPAMRQHLLRRQADSIAQLKQIEAEVHDLERIFIHMRNEFTKDELAEIRGRQLKNEATQDKLINMMARISTALFNKMEIETNRPGNINEAPDYYLFRYAVVVVHFFFRFVKAGNLTPQANGLVNHIIDLQLIAEATYFNGILSNDKVIVEIFPIARWLIKIMGGYVPTR